MSTTSCPSSPDMRTRPLLAAVLCAALVVSGCKCGKPPAPGGGAPPPLTAYLPRDGDGVLWVPDLLALGARVRALESLKVASFAAQLQGHGSGQEWAGAFLGQVGVDLRSAEALGAAGVDAGRGAAAAWSPAGAWLVVAVKDEPAFRAFLGKLATSRLGAAASSDEGNVTAWTRKDGTPARRRPRR